MATLPESKGHQRRPGRLNSAGNELLVLLGRMTRRLRQAQQPDEISPSALAVLSLLESDGPLGCTRLAALERVTPQAMSTALTALNEQGLVARTPDAADGRRTTMSITQRGRDRLAGRRSHAASAIAQAIDEALTDAEARRLLSALPLLQRVVDHL